MKIRVGNKQNSILNGEWAGHVRRFGKKITSGKRRMQDKEIIKNIKDNLKMEIINKNEISDLINSFPRKYQSGFTMNEIKELVKSFPNLDIDKYNDATSHITAICVEDNILIYPHDVYIGIICGLEKRDINEEEFD